MEKNIDQMYEFFYESKMHGMEEINILIQLIKCNYSGKNKCNVMWITFQQKNANTRCTRVFSGQNSRIEM